MLLRFLTATSVFAVSLFVVTASAEAAANMSPIVASTFDTGIVSVLTPCRSGMQQAVVGDVGQLQILDSVVGFDFVDVMDVLIGSKLASEMTGHDKAVLKDVLPIVSNQNVAIRVDSTSVFPRWIIVTSKPARSFEVGSATLSRATWLRPPANPAFCGSERAFALRACSVNASPVSSQKSRSKTSTTCCVSLEHIRSNTRKLFTAVAFDKPPRLLFPNCIESYEYKPVNNGAAQVSEMMRTAVVANTFWHANALRDVMCQYHRHPVKRSQNAVH